MIAAPPGTNFQATLEGADPGHVGDVGVEILDASQNSAVARTTGGIVEPRSGVYVASLIAPWDAGSYTLIWDTGGTNPEYGTEQLVVLDLVSSATVLSAVSQIFEPPGVALRTFFGFAGVFPPGTVVSAYPPSSAPLNPGASGPASGPTGPADDSATVTAAGSVTFHTIKEGTDYFIGAQVGGVWHYMHVIA